MLLCPTGADENTSDIDGLSDMLYWANWLFSWVFAGALTFLSMPA